MAESRFKSFNYAVGFFGLSIPINLLKTFAAVYYVVGLGLTTPQLARILFVYAFIDAVDNLVYGFLSDRTRTRWGRRRPWMVIGAPLLGLGLIAFYTTPANLAGNSLFAYAMLFYILTGTLDSVLNANYIRKSLEGLYHLKYDAPSMHECVFSDKFQKDAHGVSNLDIAKRLIDFGVHPPTMSFPLIVHGALMIEPTETETKRDLDTFISAMARIALEAGENPDILRSAPHDSYVRRLDETAAARNPVLRWKPEK